MSKRKPKQRVLTANDLLSAFVQCDLSRQVLEEPCATIETITKEYALTAQQWQGVNRECERLAQHCEALARRLRACKNDIYTDVIEIEGGNPTAA